MNPLPPDRRLQEARVAYETGDLRQAIRIIQYRLSENPEDGRAWELCGLIHYAAGHFLESLAALEQATTRVPLRPSGGSVLLIPMPGLANRNWLEICWCI